MKTKVSIKAPDPAPEAKKAKPKRWHVTVQGPARPTADRLAQAAETQAGPLPHKAALEGLFGQDLSRVEAVHGPEVDAALADENAEAAAVEGRVFLKKGAPIGVVAHEVTHVLQQHGYAAVPTEAEAMQAEVAVASGLPVPQVRAEKAPDEVAFRAPVPEDENVVHIAVAPQEARAFEQEIETETAETTEEGAVPEDVPDTVDGSGQPALDAATVEEEPIDPPVPEFAVAEPPDLEAAEAEAEAAAAEAEAALSEAEDSDDLVGAFASAPPSVKAAKEATLAQKAGELSAEEQAGFDADLPEFEAQMSGTDDLEPVAPVATPEGDESALDEGDVAPAPEPEVDPTPEPEPANLNEAVSRLLSLFTPGDSGSLGQSFNRIGTSDDDVDTSAGARPDVPQEGETDPARASNLSNAARDDAGNQGADAQRAVLEGPGPEQVGLREVRESFVAEAREMPAVETAADEAEGIAAFNAKELDPEVTALFDAHHSQAMQDSMAEAEAETQAATQARDTDRDAELATAEAERDRVNAEADQSQRDEALRRRQDIQDARQTAVDDQAAEVDAVRAEADTEQADAAATIDTEITDAETGVEDEFSSAETDAEAEVTAGEREAEQERSRREREAENDSWWDRATDWVADQLSALTSFINDVFDAVRSAVKDLIDAAKDAALRLIDAAAQAIKDAITQLGEALQSAVNALLAEHFPEVARVLNEAIDGAVELAHAAVDVIAEGLKAAVSLVLDALAAGLDAILAAYQAALTGALALLRMAVTADWAELAKMILEPVLMALGIQPSAFYELIGRAVDALDLIIDDPVGFLSNLVDTVTGGIRLFAENLFQHLQRGVIAWLAGPLGSSIQLPETWDLWGVLDLARQILGLTVEMIRNVAVRILGEEAVERIEFFMGYVVELITGGFTALWERITQDLANLQDMVLDQIKTFLIERVVMAAISWLAGLFSPVGALVKLVMTVWNFLMFLKDQFMRMYAVVQKVVNTMYEIATGVLEPAQRGIEEVIGRLLPIAIDLLARLLGLGNVPARVQEIIRGVRQAIEDAITNLIRRVLARFTGGRGGADGDPEGTDNATDLMQPVPFSGGGERHSLYIEEQGEDAVPMMRSTPQPVATWLNNLRGPELRRIGAQKDPVWTDDDITRVSGEINPLIDRAIGEEAQVNTKAEEADDAQEANAEAPPSPELRVEAEELAEILSQILEALGLDAPPIEVTFTNQIGGLDPAVRPLFDRNILPWMQENAADLQTLTWDQVVDRVVAGAGLSSRWLRTGLKASIPRTELKESFLAAVTQTAVTDATARISANNESATGAEPFSQDNELESFFQYYLAEALNQPAVAAQMTKRMLDPAGGAGAALAALPDVDAAIKASVGRMYGQPRADFVISDTISKTNFQDEMIAAAENTGAIFGPFYESDEHNLAGDGASTDQTLLWFLGTSRRQGKNREHYANAIRQAQKGQHEWIPGSMVNQVIEATAGRIETNGDGSGVGGVYALINFQHQVRTPTQDLIFKPAGTSLPSPTASVNYVSPDHYAALQAGDVEAGDDLSNYYWQRDQNTPTPALEAHSGGLQGVQVSGTAIERRRLQGSSTEWHNMLREKIKEPLADFHLSKVELDNWSAPILAFVEETIWQGVTPLAGGTPRFDLYYVGSSGNVTTYDELGSYAFNAYDRTVSNLVNDMERVLS